MTAANFPILATVQINEAIALNTAIFLFVVGLYIMQVMERRQAKKRNEKMKQEREGRP